MSSIHWKKKLTEPGISSLTTAILFLISYFFFTPKFSLDDEFMRDLSAGIFFSQEASEFLIYCDILIGILLKYLTLIWPKTSWYSVFLSLTLYFSVTVLAYIFIKRFGRKHGLLLFTTIFFGLIHYALIKIYFTTVAAFACFAGLTLLFKNKKEQKSSRTEVIFAGFLLLLSFLLRKQSAALVFVISLPFIFRSLYLYREQKRPVFLFLFGVFSVFLGMKFFESYYYNTYFGFHEVHSYLNNISRFLDFNHLPRGPYQAAYLKEKWSINDTNMLNSWFFTDQTVFGPERLTKLLAFADLFSVKYILQDGIKENLLFSLNYFFRYFLPPALVVLLFIRLTKTRLKIPALLFSGSCILTFFGVLFLAFFLKFPLYHLGYLFAVLPAVSLLFFTQKISSQKIWPAYLLLFLACLFPLKMNYTFAQANRHAVNEFKQFYTKLTKNKLYIWWDYSENLEAGSLFLNPEKYKQINKIHLGTLALDPFITNVKQKFNIQTIRHGVIDNEQLILISKKARNTYFTDFMKEHYHKNIYFKQLYSRDGFLFYTVHEK